MALSYLSQPGKQVKLSDGTTYAYLYIPAKPTKSTFLLLHGFPSSSYDWRHQVETLSSKGFGLLIPDLLGYGDTDAPKNIEAYAQKIMAGHMAEILDKEGLTKVVGVAHDWGCGLLANFHLWYSDRLKALIYLSVGHTEFSDKPFDLDAYTAQVEAAFGYNTFGYWKVFNTDGAGKLLDENAESMASLFYPANYEIWKNYLCPIGGLQRWIDEKKTSPPPSWMTSEEMAHHIAIIAKKGYGPGTNWYKGGLQGVDCPYNVGIPEDRNRVDLPTLLIVGIQDCVCRPEVAKMITGKWVKNLKVEELDCGHWVQAEKPKETNALFERFANELV